MATFVKQLTVVNGLIQNGIAAQVDSPDMVATGVSGSYTAANITVDIAGRITAASSGIGGGLTSGSVGSGFIASGTVQGFFGSTRHIASGTLGVFDFGSGAVIAGVIGSGAVQSGNIGSGIIASGHLASGLIANLATPLSSGQVQSGIIASGAIQGFFGSTRNIASGTLGVFDFGSGGVVAGVIGSGAVQSGNIGSGVVASGHLASGLLANIIVAIGSGSVSSGDIQSGAVQPFDNIVGNVPGSTWYTIQTAEAISGSSTDCVAVTPLSGSIVTCVVGSGLRMPSVGVVNTHYASGDTAVVYVAGILPMSLQVTAVGNGSVCVGSGGTLVRADQVLNFSGSMVQRMGFLIKSGFCFLNVDPICTSGTFSVTITGNTKQY